ncbi:MAG: class I SAM-dependent methyltransferase [Gammaproteobacteria bacterium]|nr:class I SAM-dependent methyltransferase [Gammaproteobacteria bacterium]
MYETAPSTDPRWGQEGRDRKAEAILRTLQLHCDRDMRRGTWLDIGCGSGGIAATLAGHVERVVGVDPEPWERWQSYRSQHPNLSFHVGSYRDLETLLGADSCSVVVCNQVYEHVDNPMALLASIHRVLKSDGVCYFAGPNLLWPIEPHVFWPFVHWLPRKFAQRLMRLFGSKRADELNAYSIHYWRLMGWFRNAGFSPSVIIAARLNSEFAARGWLVHLPEWFATLINAMAPLSPGFVFSLRKL